jgi:hypothetical protein
MYIVAGTTGIVRSTRDWTRNKRSNESGRNPTSEEGLMGTLVLYILGGLLLAVALWLGFTVWMLWKYERDERK